MKNNMKRIICGALSLLTLISTGCGTANNRAPYDPAKKSEELLYFKSSDEQLDFFLNDYYKRHAGWINEKGQDQKVNSVTAGVTGQQFFWQEWMSLAYYPFNSRDGFETDRIEGLRRLLSGVPVDRYGYVWQESDLVRDANSTLHTGEHRMGWPFPTSYHSDGQSRSWDFNGNDQTNWSSNIGATVSKGLLSGDVESGMESIEFVSPVPKNLTYEICSYYAPLLEIDLRMYTGDSNKIEDIYVWYTTADSPEWSEDKKVSVKEKAFIDYDFTPVYEHLLFLPMYAEEAWKSDKACKTYIREIKVQIKAKDGEKLTGKYGLSYVRPAYDTRHVNNNSLLISSLRTDFDYTNDIEYLKENITRARKAINFYMQMYDENRHLNDQSYLVGHDSDKTSDKHHARTAMSLGNGYWDISFMPRFDFQSNMYFYDALVDLAYLEKVLEEKGITIDKSLATVMTADRSFNHGTSEYTYDSASLSAIAQDVLTELRKTVNKEDKTGFWSEETGRFVAGYADTEDKWYDYGYTMWNMEAIYYGVATDEQAKSIMDWIGGKRIVEQDKYGSQGEDIYYFEFAPRTNTYTVEDQYNVDMFTGFYSSQTHMKYGEVQVQNGGAIMYTSFYDLMSRVKVNGANDAFSRLKKIGDWYQGVYDYYVISDNYNTHPDRFYWDYYCKGQWKNPKNKTYYPQNGIKGTQERNDGGGIVGIDGEFLESLLMIAAVPYGFFGIQSIGGTTLQIQPSLPSDLDFWGMENLSFGGVKYDLTMFKNSVKLSAVRGDAAGLSVQVILNAPKAGERVYVNGRESSRYTVKGDKVYITLPLEAANIEVR